MFQQLLETLRQGFYVDNLRKASRISLDLALKSEDTAALFVVNRILSSIADYWDDRPIIVEEAQIVENGINPSIINLIEALESSASSEIVVTLLNKVVSKYLFFFSNL